MSFFGKLWAVIRGIFIRAGDDVVSSSPEAIRATYATAIDEAKRRYKDMEKAVALLAREREKSEMSLKDLQREELEAQRKLDGSLAAAEAEPENPDHREAGARYISRIKEIGEKQTKLTEDLEGQKSKVEEYKMKPTSLTDREARKTGEWWRGVGSNQQVVQLEDRLRGLGESAVDESIVAIREKVAGLRHQAKIAAEMRGAGLQSQDEAYERMGAEREAAARFDELLKARAAAKVGVSAKERDLG
jgi:hypothetical protein